ncbi:unnamed protein product [Mycena citricolor]|uniref:Uncharacterized protein n=1 Tax=Mycena citricolor TaxID=2018698 RepID=A0AAD2K6R0_9AGAR|nr:unnamed protein product [Mycena citricolor]
MRLPVFALSLYTAFLGQTQVSDEIQGALGIAGGSVSSTTPTRHSGTIIHPMPGSLIELGKPFPFAYKTSNWCHTGYTHISAWLMDYEPGEEDLDKSGKLQSARYHFGDWTLSNFAQLPDLPENAPAELMIPGDVMTRLRGPDMYFSVVENATDCPPRNVPTQFGLTSSPVYVL